MAKFRTDTAAKLVNHNAVAGVGVLSHPEIERRLALLSAHPALSTGAGTEPVVERPSGTIDGTNTVFRLTYEPYKAWVVLMLDNALEDPITDYTLDGSKITYATAPGVGDQHCAWYFKTTSGNASKETASGFGTYSSAAGVGKILYIPNGGTFPIGWKDYAFDDSSWGAPVLVPGSGAITGTDIIADISTARGSARPLYNLFRLKFDMGISVASSATLDLGGDDAVGGVWLNGTSITVGSVDPTLFRTGPNIFACEMIDTLPSFIKLTYKLTIS